MDPFIQVYNDTEEQLNHLSQILQRKKLTSNTNTAEITDIIRDVEETIADLKESIEVVRHEQALPLEEINSREKSMAKLETKLAQCTELFRPLAAETEHRDSFDIDLEANASSDAAAAASDDNAVQEQLLREQDGQLDMIHQTMQSLHLQASTMGQELSEQGMMLEEMDGQVDGVLGKLSRGRRQLEWVYEHNKEKLNDCCIGLLIVALIVLLVLAFIL